MDLKFNEALRASLNLRLTGNSLTALSEVVPILECFICLDSREPLVDNTLLRTCGCKFIVHPECWAMWIKNKDAWDCPICRRESLTSRLYFNETKVSLK